MLIKELTVEKRIHLAEIKKQNRVQLKKMGLNSMKIVINLDESFGIPKKQNFQLDMEQLLKTLKNSGKDEWILAAEKAQKRYEWMTYWEPTIKYHFKYESSYNSIMIQQKGSVGYFTWRSRYVGSDLNVKEKERALFKFSNKISSKELELKKIFNPKGAEAEIGILFDELTASFTRGFGEIQKILTEEVKKIEERLKKDIKSRERNDNN